MRPDGSSTPGGAAATPPWDHDTHRMSPPAVRRLLVFRHRLESIATRMAADCERMLRQVPPDRTQWRSAIGEALLAGRHIASLTQVPVPADPTQPEREVAQLENAARGSFDQIVAAMATVLRFMPVTVADELLLGDARAISGAAASAMSTAAAPEPDVAPARPGTPAAGARPIGQAGRILIIDDDADVRRLLHRHLTRLGYEVLAAENGREGLETAGMIPVDLILTDMNMPEMDGMAMLKELKSSATLRDVPVVVISSEDASGNVAHSIELGAEDHIGKPFDPVILGARVRASLLRKRMRDLELDYLRRVGVITAAAESVDRDAYVAGTLGELARGHDELANLARVFERVVLNMKSREERLGHRLRLLRSEMGLVSSSGSVAAAASADSPFGAGQVVAERYRVIGRVGRGGMGMVYHATDLELHEDVALKVVRADLIREDPTLISRFKSEIRLARRLSHRNILRTHDLGDADGTYFISMEYVRGVTLAELLDQRGRISVDSTLAIGAQLADALAVAHAEDIVHRDIKPSNILMQADGTLKMMDFGLAKRVVKEPGNTVGGFVVGTPPYMAPEQLMGGDLDTRADLFAVGVVLYECLTGRTPFDAVSPVELAAQMIDGAYPALAGLVPGLPPRLDAIVTRLLNLRPEDRVQKASELSLMLAEIEQSPVRPGEGPAAG